MSSSLPQNAYLLALHRAGNLTLRRYQRLLQAYQGDWEKAWNTHPTKFTSAGLTDKDIAAFLETKHQVSPEAEWKQFQAANASILTIDSPDYPASLINISSPPAILFVQGQILDSDFPSISVVGSRNLTAYGKRVTEKIVGDIAAQGVTIVSGLAFGADFAAHQAAIKNNSRTLCVLGNGIGEFYPKQHELFARKIIADGKGAVISEYLPGTDGRREHFPARNRIVAGLSKATIIIEAALKSGSLITAHMAMNENRDVFVVPGDIFSRYSQGTNELLAQGAHAALSAESILESIGLQNTVAKKAVQASLPLSDEESAIMKLFTKGEKHHINDVIRLSTLHGGQVSGTLAMLELKGVLTNIGNQTYASLLS